jgi:3-isopropylmalate/(R)-2-methylmalate dehydratase small subunit
VSPSLCFQDRRVWRLGADIDTDVLAPGAYMKHGLDMLAQHCLESLRPEFAQQVQAGDVVVAGPNFGIGSSREQAAAALRHLGIAAVVAPSFGGLFFRNAFNLGLPLLTCAQAEIIDEAERITLCVDDESSRVVRANHAILMAHPIPDFLRDMVQAGGLMNLLKQRRQGEHHG